MDLEGRTAVVTGAGRGLGRAIALKLASLHAFVVVADINTETAATTAEEIRKMGNLAFPLQIDVTKITDMESAVNRLLEETGHIDILVSCAGVAQAKDVFGITEEDWDATFSVNAKGTFFLNQVVVKHMCERGSGAVVNMSSIAGRGPRPLMLHYAASKAAVISVTKSIAAAAGPKGVRVNAVCPGVIATDMWSKLGLQFAAIAGDPEAPEEMMHLAARRAVLPRDETADDVANVVAFLVSEESEYITGQSINVDGGIHMD